VDQNGFDSSAANRRILRTDGALAMMRQRTMIHMLLKSYGRWNGDIAPDRILSLTSIIEAKTTRLSGRNV
jgi:hypothetical protein